MATDVVPGMQLGQNIKFEPAYDFMLVEPLRQNETAGGLALPDGADMDPPRGRVIRVGPGRVTEFGEFVEPTIRPGQVVYLLFALNQPAQITLAGKQYLICRARDVVGVEVESDAAVELMD